MIFNGDVEIDEGSHYLHKDVRDIRKLQHSQVNSGKCARVEDHRRRLSLEPSEA